MVVFICNTERIRIKLIEYIDGGADQVELAPAYFVGMEAAGGWIIACAFPAILFKVVIAKRDCIFPRQSLRQLQQPDPFAEHTDILQVQHSALIQNRQDPLGEFFPFFFRNRWIPKVIQIRAHVFAPF